jgi:hypothetical protein
MQTRLLPWRSLSGDQNRRRLIIILATITAVGLVVRAYPVLSAPFPLNDGGLFFVIVRTIEQGGFAIPLTISWNGHTLPFAYQPLGFYITAGLDSMSPIGLLTVIRFVPMMVSTLTIPAFYPLARELVPSRHHAVVATLVFALLPRSFEWQIGGGGITRAWGELFAILALWQGLRLLRAPGRGPAVASGLLAGLTLLSHPEWSLFLVLSAIVLIVARRPRRSGFVWLLVAVLLALIIAGPWYILALVRYGAGPLISAASAGPNLVDAGARLLIAGFGDELILPVATILAIIGAAVAASRRSVLLLGWIVVLSILDARAAANGAAIPLALLASIGLIDGLLPALQLGRALAPGDDPWPIDRAGRPVRVALLGLAAVMLLNGLLASFNPVSPLTSLSEAQLAAMAWVRTNLPTSASVVVVSGETWPLDAASEWFPALTNRHSVDTLQGEEWLGADAWSTNMTAHESLVACATAGVGCLNAWAARTHTAYQYVFVTGRAYSPAALGSQAQEPMWNLAEAVRASSAFKVLYDGPGALIARAVVNG